MRVLFVCSGNICRSPMAEFCLRRSLDAAGLCDVTVLSAGTLGIEGVRASSEAIVALEEIGVGLSTHRSQGVTAALMDDSDLVIVMERAHLDELAKRFPGDLRNRVLIRGYEHGSNAVSDAPDLADPMGLPVGVYRELLNVMEPCIENLTTYIQGLGSGRNP